jgi:hypothetical protein
LGVKLNRKENMTKEFVMTCPNCNETFAADDAFKNHLKNKEKELEKNLSSKIKNDFEKQKKEELKEISNKLQESEKEKIAYAKKIVEKEKDFKNKEKELEKNLSSKIKNDFEKQKKEELKEISNKLQESEKEKIAYAKKIVEKEKDFKNKEKELEKNLQKQISAKLEKQHELDIQKKDKETEIANRRQLQRISEMEKQLKQKSMELQGEGQEELIEDYLFRKFPSDKVSPVKKGVKGGDCILTIRSKNQEPIGEIYFESKDQKSFKEEWVSKLLNDMKEKNIGYGILITVALPKDFEKNDGYVTRHGKRIIIIPMNYPLIHSVVSPLRNHLIEEAKNKKDFDAPREMKRAWDFITSNEFHLSIRNLAMSMIKMKKLIEKEKAFYEKNIANKENALLDMKDELSDLVLSFRKKVGDVLPENLLENKEDNQD